MKNRTNTLDMYSETGTLGGAEASPDRPKKNLAARIYFGLVAMIGTAALTAGMTVATTNGGWAGLVSMLSEMTYWTNILVAIVGFALVLNPQRDGRIFRWLRLSTLVMITIVGIVYPLVLAGSADLTGVFVYTSLALHYIVPWATVLGFLIFGPRPRISWAALLALPIIPLTYTAYAITYGALLNPAGEYPYPFLDPSLNAGGETGVAAAVIVITLFGVILGFVYLGLDRLLSRGAKPADLSVTVAPVDVAEMTDSAVTARSREPMLV
ncbi:MAG: Pr6Pr family membrane protein [Actinomycetia bacterium]|nr:Pr6Pr family membrane protein [Actinomycetes bacterium]